MILPLILFTLTAVLAAMLYAADRHKIRMRELKLERRLKATQWATKSLPPDVPEHHKIRRVRRWDNLERWLTSAGMQGKSPFLITLVAGLGMGGFVLSGQWLDLPVALVIACVLAAAPLGYVALKRRHRLKMFGEELPMVLDFLRSAMQSGHTLVRGLQVASENAPESMAVELRAVVDHVRMGGTLPEALETMCQRIPEDSLRFLTIAVRVQAGVGSGIAEILDRVSSSIRDRHRLERQVRILTAQPRMSGIIVASLPIVVFIAFTLLNPEYTRPMLHTHTGVRMLEIAAGLDLGAIVLIRRLVRVD